MTKRFRRGLAASTMAGLFVTAAFQASVFASHPWGLYHWARTSNPFTLKLNRHLTSAWRPSLDLSSEAWTTASKLNTTIVTGLVSDATTRQNCPTVNGRVAVCNYTYGTTGWLGLAQIWVDVNSHIYKGRTLLNDSYASSWTPAFRQFVMCQEVGHTFGLGHQDETFGNANLGSCMDYTSNPLTPPNNLALNGHDHDQLNAIYAHTDGYTTLAAAAAAASAESEAPSGDDSEFNHRGNWGLRVASHNGGRTEIFERELGGGIRLVTHVVWAERGPR
jgi:hypothetical protein